MKPSVIVIGAGIVGRSIAAHLAARGYSVKLIDQFGPAHARGSSHGDSRLYRRAPFEGDVYVTLAAEAFEGWQAWNRDSGEALLEVRGGYDISSPETSFARDSETLARDHGAEYRMLQGADINQQYPIYNIPDDWPACYVPESGVISPEPALPYLLTGAEAHGAEIFWNGAVTAIDPGRDRVGVVIGDDRISADHVVVAAGPWVAKLIPGMAVKPRIIRNVLCWFQPRHPSFADMPIFAVETSAGLFYGMATASGLLKVAKHGHLGEIIDPDIGAEPVSAVDEEIVSAFVADYFDHVEPAPVQSTTCLYTELPEKHFLIDFHPENSRLLIFSPCSGHGFKYAPLYGGMAERMIADGTPPHPEYFSFGALAKR